MITYNIIMALGLTINLIFMPALVLKAILKTKKILNPKINDSYCVIAIWILLCIVNIASFVFLQNTVYLVHMI